MESESLTKIIQKAITNRSKLIKELEKEGTDCYRLFYGTNEGYPGLSIDKYGNQIIIQSFRTPLESLEVETIKDTINNHFQQDPLFIYRHRKRKKSELLYIDEDKTERDLHCSELGLTYEVIDFNQGLDPLLFLDLRAGRRYLAANCKNKSVLNLFSYTCSAGIVAAANGAESVTNVDFSKTWLNYGKNNAARNNIQNDKITFIEQDFFPVIRQFSGLEVKGKAARRKYRIFKEQKFDLIFMDPPTLAKSGFGAVDIVNDYQSLFKPAFLSLNEGGEIICTNHAASVEIDTWISNLKKCADKAGKPIKEINQITPDSDFPSYDYKHPLKILSIKF